MSRKQWFLTGAAVIVIVFLFSLPKIIIDNDAEEIASLDERNTKADTANNSPLDPHSVIEDSLQLSSVEKYKSAYQLAENKKKKSIFADSLARAYARMRDFDKAIDFAREALELSETTESREVLADVYYNAMTFALDMEQAGELGKLAREQMEAVLEEQPRRFDLMNKVAMTYVVSEAPMKGIMMLREILEKDPDNEEAIFNMGVLSIQSGQYDKGVERFSKLITLDSTNIKAWYYLGLCLKETGEVQEAREVLTKAAGLDTDPEVQASINALLDEL